jgi:hypothetical protein
VTAEPAEFEDRRSLQSEGMTMFILRVLLSMAPLALAGCISLGGSDPPRNTTIVVPPSNNTTVVCSTGGPPPCQ